MKRFPLAFISLAICFMLASCASKGGNSQLASSAATATQSTTGIHGTSSEAASQTDMSNQKHGSYGLVMKQDGLQVNATISGLNLQDTYPTHEKKARQSIYLYSWGITFGDYLVVMGVDPGRANGMDSIETFKIPASLWKISGNTSEMIDPDVGVSVSLSAQPNSDQISFFISPPQNMDLNRIEKFSLEIVEDGAVVYTQQYSSDKVIPSNAGSSQASQTPPIVTAKEPSANLNWAGTYTDIDNPAMKITITGSMENGYHIVANDGFLTTRDVTKESISANAMAVFTEMDNKLTHALILEGDKLTYRVSSADPGYQQKFGYQNVYKLNN